MGLFIPLCLLGSQLSIPALLPIHGLHFPASVFSEWDLAYCSVTYGGNQITQSGQRGGAQQRGRWKHWLWKGHHLSSQRSTGLDAGALFFWVFLVFFPGWCDGQDLWRTAKPNFMAKVPSLFWASGKTIPWWAYLQLFTRQRYPIHYCLPPKASFG